MNKSRLIVVTGATGAQGGGLARAILAAPDSGFSVRAITRKPGSDKARQLAELGAEVVEADLDDPATVQRAFKGAYGAFCVTNFWEHFSPEREQDQARAMAEAAKHHGLRHVVWSTLEDVRRWVPLSDTSMPTLGGRWKVPHFDGKGEMDAVFTGLEVPTTFMRVSFYWENFIYFGMGPKPNADGNLALTLPMADKKLTGIAAGDIGKCAFGIFNRGLDMVGKTIGLAGAHLSGDEMAAEMSRALGRDVRYAPLSFDAYRALGFPGADDLGNMFQFYCEFEELVRQARPVEATRRLNPELQDFSTWLSRNARRFPLE